MLNLLVKIFSVLNSETSSRQISWAIVLAFGLGLIPANNLLFFLILLFIFVLRVNISMALVAFGLSSGVAYLLSPALVMLGEFLLTKPELQSFWASCYQSDLLRLLHFNQTRVLGSFVVAILASLPLYFACLYLIEAYRKQFSAWSQKLAIVKMLKASRVYQLYQQTRTGV